MMLETFIEAEDQYNSSFRPAVMESIRAMLKYYQMESPAAVYYNGEAEVSKLVGSNASDEPNAAHYTDGIFRNKIYVKTTVEKGIAVAGENQRRMPTEMPTWSDDGKLPLILTPAYEGSKVICSISCQFNSSVPAENFRAKISRLRQNQASNFSFRPTGHYILNPSIINLFTEIHGLLEKNDPSTPDLLTWFKNGSEVPITTISNVKGNHDRNAQAIRIGDVGLYFSEPFIADPERANSTGRYLVNFEYYYFFQVFIGWELKYPLNVYQDEINPIWIPQVQTEFERPTVQRVAPEIAFARALSAPAEPIDNPYYLKIPNYDPWKPDKQAWMQTVIQARLRVEDLPEQSLCNIFEIPGYEWDASVVSYMKRRHEASTKHLHTFFLVQVWSNSTKVNEKSLSLDENGNLFLLHPPVMSNTYRLVIMLDWAIRDWLDDVFLDLREHPEDQHLVKRIFRLYDWDQFDDHWLNHIHQIRRDIAKGWGRPGQPFNQYMMNMDLFALNILQEK